MTTPYTAVAPPPIRPLPFSALCGQSHAPYPLTTPTSIVITPPGVVVRYLPDWWHSLLCELDQDMPLTLSPAPFPCQCFAVLGGTGHALWTGGTPAFRAMVVRDFWLVLSSRNNNY